MVDADRRALVAAGVSVAGAVFGIGGAGHAYLREWGRAFVWFTFVLGVGLVLVSSLADPETATLATLPLRVTVPLVLLLALNTADAYYIARRGERSGAGTGTPEPTVSCPSCGRELDPGLSFCPWCAGSRNEEE